MYAPGCKFQIVTETVNYQLSHTNMSTKTMQFLTDLVSIIGTAMARTNRIATEMATPEHGTGTRAVAAATTAEQNNNNTDTKKRTAVMAPVPFVPGISDSTIRNLITGHGTHPASVLNEISSKTSTVNDDSSEKQGNSVTSDAATHPPILNIKMSPHETREWKESYTESINRN
jgi:hypothetical protein